jgi:hypothetical protein
MPVLKRLGANPHPVKVLRGTPCRIGAPGILLNRVRGNQIVPRFFSPIGSGNRFE